MRSALPAVLAAAILAAAVWAPAAAEPAPGPVLVIGDSLEGGTAPYLRAELGGIPLTVDQRTGRPSPGGVRALAARLRPEHRTVVFDVGVNDDPRNPSLLAESLAAARQLAGDRCLVVATLQRPPLGGATVAGLNSVIKRFVAETPRVELVDWHAVVQGTRGLLLRDGVHATPRGYAVRGSLVADAVAGCLVPDVDVPPASRKRRRPHKPRQPAIELPHLGEPAVLAAVEAVVRNVADMLAAASRDVRRASGMKVPEPVLGR